MALRRQGKIKSREIEVADRRTIDASKKKEAHTSPKGRPTIHVVIIPSTKKSELVCFVSPSANVCSMCFNNASGIFFMTLLTTDDSGN